MFKSIRTNILFGLLLVTPLVVTAFVANWLFTFTTNQFLPLFPKALRDANVDILLRIASLLLVFIALFLIGVLARNILGRRLYQLGDRIITRIPFINRIYVGTRQVIDAFISQRETVFNQVVLVEWPRRGAYVIAFQTATVPTSFRGNLAQGQPDREFVALFMPTTPNPTTGFLCFVPKSDVIPLPHYSSGDAMKTIISAGVVYPGERDAPAPTSLVDKLHQIFHHEPRPPTDPPAPEKPAGT